MFATPVGIKSYYVYFMKLEHGYYYVGITNNLGRRLQQHRNGRGSVITRAHRPLILLGSWYIGEMEYKEAEYIENEFTLYFMQNYGTKVRGGRWCKNKENVAKVIRKHAVYCPYEQFAIVAHDVEIPRQTEPKINKKSKKKQKIKRKKFKNRQEKVEWICTSK